MTFERRTMDGEARKRNLRDPPIPPPRAPHVRGSGLGVKVTRPGLGPGVAADIYDRGVILTGGGSLLEGIDQYMRAFINLPVTIADEPRYATVNGLVKMFDDQKLLDRVARNELSVLQNAEIPFEA